MDWDQLVGVVEGRKEKRWPLSTVSCPLLASSAFVSYCFPYLSNTVFCHLSIEAFVIRF